MEFCLDLTHHAWTRGDPLAAVDCTVALARAADTAGMAAIWVNEDPEGWDAFALLGALARETTRVRLGTGVTSPYPRHPNLLAAAVATLDRLSAGRAVLGLGRGQPEWYGRALGAAVDSPLAALEALLDLLDQWWAPPHRASAAGPFPVHDWERTVHPAQARPPIFLAAVGPRALDLAARRADGVIFNALTGDAFLTEAIAQVRASAIAAGRDPRHLAFVLRTAVTVTDDPAPHLERQKSLIALVNALPGMERPLATPGFDVSAIVAEVRRTMRTTETLATGGGFPALRRNGDLVAARAAIPTALVARLTIAGSLAAVRTRLRGLADLGITHVSVAPPGADEPTSVLTETVRSLRGSG